MERNFSILVGMSIVLHVCHCTTAKKLGVITENFSLGGFEGFHGVLFKRLLNLGFKSYVVDVSVIL